MTAGIVHDVQEIRQGNNQGSLDVSAAVRRHVKNGMSRAEYEQKLLTEGFKVHQGVPMKDGSIEVAADITVGGLVFRDQLKVHARIRADRVESLSAHLTVMNF